MSMWRWITFGDLPEEMRGPYWYSMITAMWAALLFVVWAFTPWFPWK